tara:strand:+ start:287 stop:604 length:318 start_codon:yes stop_codon:yes gene_type:complete
MGMISFLGTAVGAGAGFLVGGPAGAKIGAGIGGTIGSAAEGNKGQDKYKTERSVTPASTSTDNIGLMKPTNVDPLKDVIEVAKGADPWLLRETVNSWFKPLVEKV